MKTNIIHPSLNIYGGAEFVCISIIEILNNIQYEVHLYTLDKVDWSKIHINFGKHDKPIREHYLYNQLPYVKIKLLNWGLWSLSYIYLLYKTYNNNITLNNYGHVLPISSHFTYIHSLPLFYLKRSTTNPQYDIPLWNIFSKIYSYFCNIIINFKKNTVYVINSKYTKKFLHNKINNKLIIHPPVNISNENHLNYVKENIILVISRINNNKMLYIIPHIAKNIKLNYKFLILGSEDKHSDIIIEHIKKQSINFGVYDNINFFINPSRSQISRACIRAKIYLSTQPTEAFGISIVEAMARGCVPVVPKDGGPWLDILDRTQNYYGCAYSNIEEASDFLSLILDNDDLRNKLATRAVNRAKCFNQSIFKKRIKKLYKSLTIVE